MILLFRLFSEHSQNPGTNDKTHRTGGHVRNLFAVDDSIPLLLQLRQPVVHVIVNVPVDLLPCKRHDRSSKNHLKRAIKPTNRYGGAQTRPYPRSGWILLPDHVVNVALFRRRLLHRPEIGQTGRRLDLLRQLLQFVGHPGTVGVARVVQFGVRHRLVVAGTLPRRRRHRARHRRHPNGRLRRLLLQWLLLSVRRLLYRRFGRSRI